MPLFRVSANVLCAAVARRSVMESYARNVRFCIICNYVAKITPAIQSRCTR